MHGGGCVHGRGGMHGGGVHGKGACMAGVPCMAVGHAWWGMCDRGECVWQRGMHGGACVTGGNVCGRGGMCGRGGDMHGRRDGHCSRQHTSYCNGLLPIYFKFV